VNPPGASTPSDLSYRIAIVLLPLLLFFWMTPFVGWLNLGNDYTVYPIPHQMELMFSIKTGSFPLFVPGFAVGQSASALSLGQVFHPISHFSSHMPGYWHGMAAEWNTLFRLLSLGIAQLVLFSFLRRLRFPPMPSFFLSFITVYNLHMLALFVYGASLESWTGFLLLCSAIGFTLLERSDWKGPLGIAGATYWLVCSGHPQMMYYGMIGSGLFSLIIPFFVQSIAPGEHFDATRVLKFWGLVFLSFCGGIVLSSAFILPYYFDFIAENTSRMGREYAWADMYRDTIMGTLNNFFMPFRTSVSGNFGGTSLFIVPALMPLMILLRVRIPRVMWATWGLFLLAFLHMQGGRLPVHHIMWKYLPLASSFRVAGRISMIVPLLLMLILAWLFKVSDASQRQGKGKRANPVLMLGSFCLLLFLAFNLITPVAGSKPYHFSPIAIRSIPSLILAAYAVLGAISLAAFCAWAMWSERRERAMAVLCAGACLQALVLFAYGTWVEPKKNTPGFQQMLAEKQESLSYRHEIGAGLEPSMVMQQVERSCLEPFLGKFYSRAIPVKDMDEAYSVMAKGRSPDQVILEGYAGRYEEPHPDQDMPADSRVDLVYSSFNALVFAVESSRNGFFGLSYPFSGHWRATVNGRNEAVYRANGISHAVAVPTGRSRVEFRYWSRSAFVGMSISCLGIVLAGAYVLFRCPSRKMGLILSGLAAVFGIGLFLAWYASLYAGDNLNTRYTWRPSPETFNNLAYGRLTKMAPYDPGNPDSGWFLLYPYLYPSGRAVDGDRSPQSGFISELTDNPWWYVDLAEPEKIGSVAMYLSRSGDSWNSRPLQVLFSTDFRQWQGLAVTDTASPVMLDLKGGITARYVMVRSAGRCRLSIDEVELYPPRP